MTADDLELTVTPEQHGGGAGIGAAASHGLSSTFHRRPGPASGRLLLVRTGAAPLGRGLGKHPFPSPTVNVRPQGGINPEGVATSPSGTTVACAVDAEAELARQGLQGGPNDAPVNLLAGSPTAQVSKSSGPAGAPL